MTDIETIVKRLDARAGYKLVSYREVGLPVFELSALLTLQERSPIGALEEFTLRCIHLKLDSPKQMQAFLGVPDQLVGQQLGALLHEQRIRQISPTGDRYVLTPKGLHVLDECSTVKVSKDDIRLYLDGITRQLLPIDRVQLYSGKQLEEIGSTAILPSPRRSPRPDDITLQAINRLFGLYAAEENERRLAVKLHGFVRPTYLQFRPGIAMAFKSDNGRDIAIAFAIDGRISDEHEIHYARSGAAERSTLLKDLFDSNKRRSDIQSAKGLVRDLMPGLLEQAVRPPAGSLDAKGRKVLRRNIATPAIPAGNVRTLSVYDHPPLLEQAFVKAQTRILLISPWIRSQVVNKAFLSRLEASLKRKVQVTIAYGFGKVDRGEKPEDSAARARLEELTDKYPTTFRLVNKGNVHAKVLLVDDHFFVTTSFNWLSFKGDPAQPMREEEGTYVEGADLVNDYFRKLQARL